VLPLAALFSNRDGGSVVIRGYVPQGAGFYTRYYVYVIQWQRARVVYMSLGQFDILTVLSLGGFHPIWRGRAQQTTRETLQYFYI